MPNNNPTVDDDPKFDENASYPVTEYISRWMRLAELNPKSEYIQFYATQTIEWANGLPPDAIVDFVHDEQGRLRPHSETELMIRREHE